MKIAPVDIRNQHFKKVVRGADPEEVRIFLSIVADEMERLINTDRELQHRVVTLETQVEEYRKVETALRDTLLTAERVSSEARENSRKEAELILRDAELRAERILDDTARRASELRREIVELKNQKEIYVARLRSLVETQLKLLRFHSADTEDEEETIEKLREVQRSLGLEAEEPRSVRETCAEHTEEQSEGEIGIVEVRSENKPPSEDTPYVEIRTREGE